MKHLNIFIILFFISCNIFTQNYCVNLTKEQKSIQIKQNKTITFSLLNDTILTKAKILTISTDSITFYLKKEKQHKTIAISKIGLFAYTKKSFWVALPTYYLAMGVMSIASNGAPIQPVDFVEPKSFRKNMKVEEGWSATIIDCSKK